ncbi:efflux RND transporter periplasmic adaptor subunit [Cohnella zeiphila]|uniref:Efflux RND transporter periplasmic adaptor subunit n=1 Tax=Cohnella zeiphila TaxID=2761120 RepID=A0A7X0SGB1_9BACL|nr:efflux RND transporter periplasmic adaptor subunit [Cohnella zeiphila]MBB6729356.1 efflux RND transporter periplasmic adaptor subunit [Cohnella zeiphila]
MKKKRWKKIVTWLVVICVLAAGGGAGYWYYNKDNTAAAAPSFQEARVTQGTITQSVTGSGSVAVSESDDAIIAEDGTVEKVSVQEGDVVKKGQVLATFEGEDVSLALNKAKLTLQQQQMSLQQAQDKWKSLKISGASDSDLEAAEMSIKSAQLNIEQTELEIQDNEDKAKAPDPLVAPIDGTITEVDIKAGDSVQARLTAFKLVNYDKLEVSISADELDITKLKVGQTANVSIEALSGQKITGTVSDISKDGTASNGVSTFPVTVTLNDIDNVLPGMSADVSIIIQQKENALIVPVDAVETVGGKYFVRVPNSGATGSSGGSGTNNKSNDAANGNGAAAGGAAGGAAKASGAGAGGAAAGAANGNGAGAGGAAGGAANGNGAGAGGFTRGSGNRSGAAGGNGQFPGRGGRTTGNASRGQGMGMMNAANGDFKMQEITVGITTDSQVEVTSGLTAGQTVLIPIIVSSGSSTTTAIKGIGAGGFGGGNFGGGGFVGGGFGGGGGGNFRRAGG